MYVKTTTRRRSVPVCAVQYPPTSKQTKN